MGQTLNNLAIVFRDQGKYREAEALFKRALAIREQALGANHSRRGRRPSTIWPRVIEQGHYGEAEGLYKRALASERRPWA